MTKKKAKKRAKQVTELDRLRLSNASSCGFIGRLCAHFRIEAHTDEQRLNKAREWLDDLIAAKEDSDF